jgi:hypothetical protein
VGRKRQINDFLFRKLIRCARCGGRVIGERQKGRYVYYRCHSADCRGTCASENAICDTIAQILSGLELRPDELSDLEDLIQEYHKAGLPDLERYRNSILLQRDQINQRISRLGDALIEGLIDKSEYDVRKRSLVLTKKDVEENLAKIQGGNNFVTVMKKKLELVNLAQIGLKNENLAEKRKFLSEVTSNFLLDGKNVEFTLQSPYCEIAKLNSSGVCDLHRDAIRTKANAIFKLLHTSAELEAEQLHEEREHHDTRLAA